MLHELRVENLLLLDRAQLALAPGLNVLTGETGAGKTLLAHALDLLLGGRARSGLVRAGATEAYVEGVFSIPPELPPALTERLPADAEEIVLARRVWPDGRTRAYVCGRSATVADLRELGGRLLAFYGQHEHRRLMLASAQLEILDGHCGADHLERRRELSAVHARVRALEERASELRELAGAREREVDLARFELEEIELAGPSAEEAEALAEERERLRNLELLRSAAASGSEAIAPEEGAGVVELLGRVAAALETAGAADPALGRLCERAQTLLYEAEDLGGELRRYGSGLEAAPGRLDEVEERLALFARLARKHGGSIETVLAHAERCRVRLAELEGADEALARVEDELADLRGRLTGLAQELRARRGQVAPKLAAAVRDRLGELAMAEAQFEVELHDRPDGCGPFGADMVELMIAPNPGIAAAPLRDSASGGELSRVMLALLSVTHGSGGEASARAEALAPIGGAGDEGPARAPEPAPAPDIGSSLLVFDEIDAGIGGHTARAVGRHLQELAQARQVLCITHLPQVAALAARHFTIAKDTTSDPARTVVTALAGDAVVGELVRMLGAAEDDHAAGQHARQLLAAA